MIRSYRFKIGSFILIFSFIFIPLFYQNCGGQKDLVSSTPIDIDSTAHSTDSEPRSLVERSLATDNEQLAEANSKTRLSEIRILKKEIRKDTALLNKLSDNNNRKLFMQAMLTQKRTRLNILENQNNVK